MNPDSKTENARPASRVPRGIHSSATQAPRARRTAAIDRVRFPPPVCGLAVHLGCRVHTRPSDTDVRSSVEAHAPPQHLILRALPYIPSRRPSINCASRAKAWHPPPPDLLTSRVYLLLGRLTPSGWRPSSSRSFDVKTSRLPTADGSRSAPTAMVSVLWATSSTCPWCGY